MVKQTGHAYFMHSFLSITRPPDRCDMCNQCVYKPGDWARQAHMLSLLHSVTARVQQAHKLLLTRCIITGNPVLLQGLHSTAFEALVPKVHPATKYDGSRSAKSVASAWDRRDGTLETRTVWTCLQDEPQPTTDCARCAASHKACIYASYADQQLLAHPPKTVGTGRQP